MERTVSKRREELSWTRYSLNAYHIYVIILGTIIQCVVEVIILFLWHLHVMYILLWYINAFVYCMSSLPLFLQYSTWQTLSKCLLNNEQDTLLTCNTVGYVHVILLPSGRRTEFNGYFKVRSNHISWRMIRKGFTIEAILTLAICETTCNGIYLGVLYFIKAR